MHAFWKPSRSVTSLLSWHKSTLHHGLCPCAHGGTRKGSHVHSERRTGMLRYSLDHTSAQCSQSLSVEGAFPKDTCFSHQQKTEKTLSSATHQINTPLVCANVMKVARATVVLRFLCTTLVAMGPPGSRRCRGYHEWRTVEATTWSLWAFCLEKAHARGAHTVVRTEVCSM